MILGVVVETRSRSGMFWYRSGQSADCAVEKDEVMMLVEIEGSHHNTFSVPLQVHTYLASGSRSTHPTLLIPSILQAD